MMGRPTIEGDLIYISTIFLQLKFAIKKLETIGLPLSEAVKVIDDVEDNLPLGTMGSTIKTKLDFVLNKKKGFATLRSISKVLSGQSSAVAEIGVDLSPAEISCFKFAPITSCDVERSFSILKDLLRDNRRSFELKNLKNVFIIKCNAAINDL